MYLAHFGLKQLPFAITPDTHFAYDAIGHGEALNTLLLALQGGEGFIKITGDVGVGKTLLCRKLLTLLGKDCVTGHIPNPMLSPRALLLEIAEELGAAPAPDATLLVKSISRRVMEIAAHRKTTVLLIDEAQTMPTLTLHTLRMLSNLETEQKKLVQIVLFGQPELDDILAQQASRPILQRITFHYRIPGLKAHELDSYLRHRLHQAGYRGPALFGRTARSALYRYSGGVPRLINILAHKSLLAAFGEGSETVSRAHVHRAAQDTEGVTQRSWW
jgi:MSHA biogenesis protein MshM